MDVDNRKDPYTEEVTDGPNEEMQRMMAEHMVQTLIKSGVPIRITINGPAGGGSCCPKSNSKINGRKANIVGLLAFGLTTVLLNLANAHAYAVSNIITASALPFGGCVQIIAAILEYYDNDNFGYVTHMAYGAFWLTLCGMWMFPTAPEDNVLGVRYSEAAASTFFVLWGTFTLVMFYCTLYKNIAAMVTFGSLVILFYLLAIAHYTESTNWQKVAGYVGIFCGVSAMYLSFAMILLNQFGREILPIIESPLASRIKQE